MLRFSNRAVSVGNVPSTGSALTGSRSPWPLMSIAVTRSTKPSEPFVLAAIGGDDG